MHGEFRLRVAYAKRDRLRWLSHLEVAGALERSVRRAGLPYAVTHAFNPRMKIAYGSALPVGTAGLRECFDVWLTRYTTAEEVLHRLEANAAEGLVPVAARYVSEALPSLTAGVVVGLYEVRLREGGVALQVVQAALNEALSVGTFSVEHRGKTKHYDLAECLPKGAEVSSDEGSIIVRMPVRMGQHGSLRPDVFLRSVLPTDARLGALVVTRTDALFEAEDGGWSRPV